MSIGSAIDDAMRGASQYQPDMPERPKYPAAVFHIRFAGTDSPEGSANIPVLEPSKRYRVEVWAEPVTAQHEKRVFIESPLTLWLTLKQGENFISEVDLASQIYEVPLNFTQFHCEFDLVTPDALPDTDATLRLEYKKSGDRAFNPSPITEQQVKLVGTYNLVNTTLARDCRIDPAIERPEKTAFLYVSKVKGKRRIRLSGWGHYKTHVFEVSRFEVFSNISLGNFISEKSPAERQELAVDMIGKVMSFFTKADRMLTQWFDRLYEQYGAELTLVISDLTDYEIPWEMYPLSGDISGTTQYLGANVSMVRWGAFSNVETKEDLVVSIQKEYHTGQVVAYIDPNDHNQYEEEKKLLQKLVQNNFLHNKEDLYQKLRALDKTGLVYIGSHGVFEPDEPLKIGLGHRTDYTKRIRLFSLYTIPSCQTPRPVFFVNACNSARRYRVGLEYTGFHEVILANFASAYIGTTGPVNTRFTLEVAQLILPRPEELADGISLAQRLRNFRAGIVNKYLGKEDEKVLYAFMYVYYGNPLAYLHISSTPTGEAGDE